MIPSHWVLNRENFQLSQWWKNIVDKKLSLKRYAAAVITLYYFRYTAWKMMDKLTSNWKNDGWEDDVPFQLDDFWVPCYVNSSGVHPRSKLRWLAWKWTICIYIYIIYIYIKRLNVNRVLIVKPTWRCEIMMFVVTFFILIWMGISWMK